MFFALANSSACIFLPAIGLGLATVRCSPLLLCAVAILTVLPAFATALFNMRDEVESQEINIYAYGNVGGFGNVPLGVGGGLPPLLLLLSSLFNAWLIRNPPPTRPTAASPMINTLLPLRSPLSE